MNTVGYSAGRVCYPGFYDALQGGVREDMPRDGAWWPGRFPELAVASQMFVVKLDDCTIPIVFGDAR